ncbi:metal-binding protein [Rhodoplanes elegans]|uniref:Metal-binding protein n=1 Tax=Rhodoplanes elegans TaxID=29408 RepID=A0A327KJI9_9BRAD|nr:DUF1636 domain-containing protein [Rhodoplanes elegans]MBK5959971.1 metal-binding protein [Rhodoplanes elegans]RAI38274.1 metal-binding protein [Rhodoplanes elegans]
MTPVEPSAPTPNPPAPVNLHVCVTCRLSADEEVRSGRLLHDALVAAQQRVGAPDVTIVPAECLSNCNRACTVAVAGPGRWSYVYGGLAPDQADAILASAARYAATADGLVPWRERPEILRKGVVARVPPLPAVPQER